MTDYQAREILRKLEHWQQHAIKKSEEAPKGSAIEAFRDAEALAFGRAHSLIKGYIAQPLAEAIAEEARDPERQGLAAVIGKWPGDETDEEIAIALRELKGS